MSKVYKNENKMAIKEPYREGITESFSLKKIFFFNIIIVWETLL